MQRFIRNNEEKSQKITKDQKKNHKFIKEKKGKKREEKKKKRKRKKEKTRIHCCPCHILVVITGSSVTQKEKKNLNR